jgi:dipeptidyl-peptidase-4
MPDDSFPRLQARTARFTLGRPRSFTVAADGSRVLFLRSRGGTDRVTCLWSYDVATRTETLIADPLHLLAGDDAVPAAERARRERAREHAAGIVGYAADPTATVIAFALSGRLFVIEGDSAPRELAVPGPVFDPRPDPTGRRVAYVSGGATRVVEISGDNDRELIAEAGVTWGLAEFIAAEELNRMRGYWWSPTGDALLVARVDDAAVQRWHIGDPANPDRPPSVLAYPAAGTANADVSLSHLTLDGSRTDIDWDRNEFPYLVAVRWPTGHPPLILISTRAQRTMHVRDVNVDTGKTTVVRDDTNHLWLEVVDGTPDRLPDGRLVTTVDLDDTRRLVIGDIVVTPEFLQVAEVLSVGAEGVVFSATTDPVEQQLWHASLDGMCSALTNEAGVHTAVGSTALLVITRLSLEHDGAETVVTQRGDEIGRIESFAEPAPFVPNVVLSTQGRRDLRTALVLPRDHIAGSASLPVLMDPYGGPGAQRVLASRNAYLNSQWLADQGFAVVVVDGRGTPGRGPRWTHAIADDLASVVLDDQITALQSLADANSDLDLTRVGIRGWSFGGYLAALAVLRRPDVFHAAVAGAAVTDWRLYDTCYTERYLGGDTTAPSYDDVSLINLAPQLTRPLMIVHGLADDNVVAANSLRLSTALLAAGRPHTMLPLSGVTHMTSQEDVAANLLMLEVAFLKSALGVS